MKRNVKYYSLVTYQLSFVHCINNASIVTTQTLTQGTDKKTKKPKTAENLQMPSKSAKQSPDHSHLAIRYPHRLRLEFPVDGPVQNAYSPAEVTLDTKRVDRGKIKHVPLQCLLATFEKVSTVDIFFPILLPIARERARQRERASERESE